MTKSSAIVAKTPLERWNTIPLKFLRCRQAWLSGILDDLDQRNAYEYLKGMVNCHRMHLFDVVNQYREIFVDDTFGMEENYDEKGYGSYWNGLVRAAIVDVCKLLLTLLDFSVHSCVGEGERERKGHFAWAAVLDCREFIVGLLGMLWAAEKWAQNLVS
ncbi:hypothetical protein H5410_012684 [Solanum commersonii]|uniref:Conserved oligomeric Golgi complex subunit 8 n=1 Tax=Solanum commersonii TaxID=4109 RepID=A0A9J6ATD1_SOLCO|nr:hypothetical protein H5410_012684 [Solanum commersonii]